MAQLLRTLACSSRGLSLYSQNPHGGSQALVLPFSEDLMPSSDFRGQTSSRKTCIQAKHYRKKKFF